MPRDLPPVYLITDRKQVFRERGLPATLESLLKAGVRMIQLREKDLTAAELYPLAKSIRELTLDYQALLLINDRIDLAQAIQADGVHLGGHSLPVRSARKILGSKAIIGVSTHRETEIHAAHAQGADFVTFGPVFYTASKAAYGSPAGLQGLHEACARKPLPIYALGGITAKNISSVRQAGADGAAMISALIAAADPAAAFQQLSWPNKMRRQN